MLKKRAGLGLWIGMVTVLICGSASAGVILQDKGNSSAQINAHEPLGQSFVAEDPHVSFAFGFKEINPGFPNDSLKFILHGGFGFDGPELASQTFNLPSGLNGFFDIHLSSITLDIGQVYSAGVIVPGTSPLWAIKFSSEDPYTDGEFLVGPSVLPLSSCLTGLCDAQFRVTPVTIEDPVSVPEPSALALLVLSAAWLGCLAHKRVNQRA